MSVSNRMPLPSLSHIWLPKRQRQTEQNSYIFFLKRPKKVSNVKLTCNFVPPSPRYIFSFSMNLGNAWNSLVKSVYHSWHIWLLFFLPSWLVKCDFPHVIAKLHSLWVWQMIRIMYFVVSDRSHITNHITTSFGNYVKLFKITPVVQNHTDCLPLEDCNQQTHHL